MAQISLRLAVMVDTFGAPREGKRTGEMGTEDQRYCRICGGALSQESNFRCA